MKSKFLKLMLIGLILFCGSKVFPEGKLFSWDFTNCDLRDILFSISLDTGISIAADDTVTGKGNFRFVGSDFETAFDSFLKSERLYIQKKNDLWMISRFCICRENDFFSIDACDLTAFQIIEKISMELNSVITFDSLPSGVYSIHFKNLSEKGVLECLVNRFSGYELIETDNGFHIGKKQMSNNSNGFLSNYVQVKIEKNGEYLIDVKDCKTSEVINKLFETESSKKKKRDFCILSGADSKVLRCCFSGKEFDDVLEKFCSQNGLSYEVLDNVYYILQGKSIKEKISGINKNWEKISLDYVKADKFIGILTKRLELSEYIILNDEYSFLCLIDEKQREILDSLKKEIDLKTVCFPIELKFLKPDELIRNIPPSIDKSSLFYADDKSILYFKGNKDAYDNFKKELALIDKPAKRISYDLLILQFDEGMDESLAGNIKMKRISSGDRNNFAVQLGSVLNLNLNVVSAFGVTFAGSLESSIENNKTKIFADTTLSGVSGKAISFQNTNTYRYRDNNLDPDTGKPVYSGITKEIISGLKLDVTGWISGDGLITSSVTASITRRGSDSSSSTGNPPPTSEKIITTEVCGRNGEPVVLSGLIENSTSVSNSRTPLLSKIPIIGWFFKSKETINQQSQMIIYLVPHIDEPVSLSKSEETTEKEFVLNMCKSIIMEEYNIE